jgi:hypothetical protein
MLEKDTSKHEVFGKGPSAWSRSLTNFDIKTTCLEKASNDYLRVY